MHVLVYVYACHVWVPHRHIHKCTLDNYGAPNKNIGDAFLLVWKPKGNIGKEQNSRQPDRNRPDALLPRRVYV